MDATELKQGLSQFYGTENYYRHPFGMVYTDGVKFLAENAAAYWLLDVIASYQPKLKKNQDQRLRDMQFWKLEVKDGKGVVTCRADSGVKPAVKQKIEYTDFPLPEAEIWVSSTGTEDGKTLLVMLLPSEY
jgi:hypothetical protein